MREKKGHTKCEEIERSMLQRKSKIVCPICGEELHEDNLPDVKSVVTENLYYLGGVVIVNSSVWLLVDFWHEFTGGGVTLDNPHPLTAVLMGEFDGQGGCIHFEIKEIRVRR